MHHTWQRGAFVISTDRERIQLEVVHRYLSESSYWAAGIPRETVARAIAHSVVFGVYEGEQQIGFARVITDRATFAYLADVFVLEGHRGQGLGVWLVEVILSHPDLQGLRRWMLVTRDAQELYRRFGFSAPEDPSRVMVKTRRDLYRST